MSTKDYSAELLKMEGVQIEKLDETEEEIILQISMERKIHICKRCGGKTDQIHDYRVREVRDLELRGKPVRLLYRRRRYACPACRKRFSETNDFVGRYMRFTHRTAEKIMELLRRRSSMKDIAKDTGTSVSGVKRVLGIMPISKPQRLPQALSFDEFKGDTGGQPFQCIVADPLNRCVFDILPDRTALTIQEYLRSFPNRDEVKYVVMDMNRGFRNIARTFLPNAQIIIDRFHVVRCCTEAMENARRSFQSSLPKEQRRYFKRSRRLLLAHRDRLSDEDCAAVDVMLRFSDRLLQAYALKEAFYHFMDAPTARPLCGVSTSGSTPATDSNFPNSNPAARRCSTGSPTYSTLSIFPCPMGLPRVATTQSRHSKESPSGSETSAPSGRGFCSRWALTPTFDKEPQNAAHPPPCSWGGCASTRRQRHWPPALPAYSDT